MIITIEIDLANPEDTKVVAHGTTHEEHRESFEKYVRQDTMWDSEDADTLMEMFYDGDELDYGDYFYKHQKVNF